VAIVAVFAQALLQRLPALEQLRDQFVPLGKLVSQCLIFCSKLDLFFFWLPERLQNLFFTVLIVQNCHISSSSF